MPEIQKFPAAALPLVRLHDVALIGDAHCVKGLVKAVRGKVTVNLPVEQRIFDRLASPAGQFARRKRGKEIGIRDHRGGLPERAHQIFPAGKVDSRLSADRRIQHGEQCGRNLNQGNSPEVRRRGKAREIPHDAPAQRDQKIAARIALRREALADSLIDGKGLAFLPRRNHDGIHRKPRRFQRALRRAAIERRHVFIRHDHGAPARNAAFRHRTQ